MKKTPNSLGRDWRNAGGSPQRERGVRREARNSGVPIEQVKRIAEFEKEALETKKPRPEDHHRLRVKEEIDRGVDEKTLEDIGY